jgi:CrcB protein
MPLTNYFIVALGGSLGAVARYQVSLWSRDNLQGDFPYGTLIVNVVGSLLFGIAFFLISEKALFNENMRLLIMVGILGSFTTFSTFSYELFALSQKGEWLLALSTLLANLVVSVLALVAAYFITKSIFQ